MEFDFISIGGGIAGVTCAETLSINCPDKRILLISASPIIKSIINFKQLTRTLEDFQVIERPCSELTKSFPNITVIYNDVISIDPTLKKIDLNFGIKYFYKKLCICTGGKPKLISNENQHVLGIRDTESVEFFESRMANARRIMIVGNGGIATELVFKIKYCKIIWAIKDSSIISTFVDAGAARFLLPFLFDPANDESGNNLHVKRNRYKLEDDVSSESKSDIKGCALGPDWINALLTNQLKMNNDVNSGNNVQIENNVEVKEILTFIEFSDKPHYKDLLDERTVINDWPVYVHLSNGKIFGVDFVVSATGVLPVVPLIINHPPFSVAMDGGINVDEHMKTSIENIFAAGDCCHAAWQHSSLWLQMRLWDQARQMGFYAAKCMQADLELRINDLQLDFSFELFAHVTKFFDHKIVLLGKFNGQDLPNDYKILIRVVEGKHYVKAVLRNGRLVGGVLVGETDLEETFENLMLNKLDLTRYGDDLLEQDIEDFFD